MATQGKAKFVSKGLRRSSNTNKRAHPMSKEQFLLLMSQGGNRVRNDQIHMAMATALLSPKAKKETIKTVVSAF